VSNRVIVTYYSRTGHTRALALEVCRLLRSASVGVESIELEAEKEMGILQLGAACFTHGKEPIKECQIELEGVNLVLLGTPVWGGNPAPFLRTLLDLVTDLRGRPVVLFATCAFGDGNAGSDLREMVRASGGRPMEYHVWRTRRDGAEGLSSTAQQVVESARSLMPVGSVPDGGDAG
jgi:flavodoxin